MRLWITARQGVLVLFCAATVGYYLEPVFRPASVAPLAQSLPAERSPSPPICLDLIASIGQEFQYVKHFRHSDYRDLFPCLLDLDFDFGAPFYPVILGSTSACGVSLCQMLNSDNMKFLQVRGKIHYDLRTPHFYDILDQVQSRLLIIDLTAISITAATSKIDSFAQSRSIPVVRLVKKLRTNQTAKQILIPRIFGPRYSKPREDCLSRKYQSCFQHRADDSGCSGGTPYVLATDLAHYLYGIIRDFSATFLLDATAVEWSGPVFTSTEISAAISLSFPECGPTQNTTFLDSVNSLSRSLNPDLTKPYVSHFTIVSDMPRVVQSYQLALQTVAGFLRSFPLISIEFICVFAPWENVTFESLLAPPEIMRRYLRVIVVPQERQKQIRARHGSTFFPENCLRNIGIRKARGTYIFCGSSDVLMPPGFFAAAEKQMFSPLSYMRSKREYIEAYEVSQIMHNFEKKLFASFHWIESDKGVEHLTGSILADACGDFQGAHRKMWHAVKGYIESREIFFVDSALAFDLSGFLPPLLVRFLPGEKHINHVKISIFTPHLHAFALINRDYMYNNLPSRVYRRREDWGSLD
jgi:hypothetical protein